MTRIKIIGYFAIWCSFLSCSSFYDKDYYERASGIKIPNSSTIVESFDNGEWYTVTSFKLSPETVHDFITRYNFNKITQGWLPTIYGVKDLKSARPDSKFKNCVWLMKENKKLNISYVVDTSAKILWASISYPDWGGR
jgi:hypothetical protein